MRPLPPSRIAAGPEMENWGLMSEENVDTGDFEVEWEEYYSASYFWFLDAPGYLYHFYPVSGDLVYVHGRQILDCGHKYSHGADSEIHPPDSVAVMRSITEGDRRKTEAYIWANGFLIDDTVTHTIYAPPRPSPRAQLILNEHESNYHQSQNVEVSTDPVPGGMKITITSTFDTLFLGRQGSWKYPPESRTDVPYFQDNWQMYWQEPVF
jgi:hypothetical protein